MGYTPQPPLLPQTGALTTGTRPDDVVDADAAAESLANPPDMGVTIARHQIAAGQVNNGDSRDWAENAVAGVQAALAGFGAAGEVPRGAGALYGVGAAARQMQQRSDAQAKQKNEEADRKQQLQLEQRRVSDEETNQNRDYQLRLAENARQQAQSVRELSEHDARMRQLDDDHNERNIRMMHDEVTFRQQQLEKQDTLDAVGAKPMQVAGKESPGFKDLGEAEQYATTNKLAEQAHLNGYRSRIVLGGDGEYHIYEMPDSGPDWHTVKGVDGKPTKIFGDPLSVVNYQEKVAQAREADARANLTYDAAKKQQDDFKEEGTAKAARAALSKVDGDVSKLSAGEREALMGDAQKRYDLSFNVAATARRDMMKDEDYLNLKDAQGHVDTGSKAYQEVAAKYHVDEADQQLMDSYHTLRKLGVGYNKPGANPPAAAAPAAAPTGQQAADFLKNQPKKGDVQNHAGFAYTFDGAHWVKGGPVAQ